MILESKLNHLTLEELNSPFHCEILKFKQRQPIREKQYKGLSYHSIQKRWQVQKSIKGVKTYVGSSKDKDKAIKILIKYSKEKNIKVRIF